ncbi:MAG: hypothetical protein IPI67_34365 [Myxococcales bacterium]|nr:hypothetical protein [Myxococcales bacterium]
MRRWVVAAPLAVALASSCVVDESFDDGQFLCDPTGGEAECPEGMSCSTDGRCRHATAKPGDAGTGGKDGGNDGSCFPTTCATLAPACGELSDGCGSSLSCGCQAPDSCGGGSVKGVCGCTKKQSQTHFPDAVFEQKITGNVAWTTLDAAMASDDKWATTAAALATGKTTNQLKASAFGFALPANATVLGVEVSIERSAAGSGANLKDQDVRVFVNGAPLATNGAKNQAWTPTDAVWAYGGAAELWGATALKKAEVEAADFGVLLTVTATAAGSPQVDAISITVHFEDPACPN